MEAEEGEVGGETTCSEFSGGRLACGSLTGVSISLVETSVPLPSAIDSGNRWRFRFLGFYDLGDGGEVTELEQNWGSSREENWGRKKCGLFIRLSSA